MISDRVSILRANGQGGAFKDFPIGYASSATPSVGLSSAEPVGFELAVAATRHRVQTHSPDSCDI